jgi:hypothetical protein
VPENRRETRTVQLAGLAILATVAVAFWPVISGSRSFFHLDLLYEHLPVWEATQKALASGESPFWIEGEHCGHPLLFVQEAPLFYPLTAPLLLTGGAVHRLADVFSLFHLWLGGFLTFLLLRDRGVDLSASLFGGMAWMLSARMVQSAIWPNAVATLALLPLFLMAVLRISDGRRRSGIVLTAVSGSLLLLLARPQALLGSAPILLSVSAASVLFADRKGRALRDLLVGCSLALALAAPSVLPAALLYPETSRGEGLERSERDLGSLSWERNLDMVFLPVDGGGRWPEAAAYPGVAVGLLFLAGLFLAARRGVEFPRWLFFSLALGGAIGLVFAFGERGPYLFFADLPLLRGFRIPARFLVSWSLAVALGSALALGWMASRLRRGPWLAASALLLLLLDLTPHARRAAPTTPAALYSVEPEVVSRVRELTSPDEVGFPRRFWSLAPQIHLQLMSDDQKALALRHLEPLKGALGLRYGLHSVGGAGPTLHRTELLFSRASARAAELAGVGADIVPAPADPALPPASVAPIVRRFSGLPRAVLVPQTIVRDPRQAVRDLFDPRFDPRQTAIVEEGEALRPSGEITNGGSVRLVSRSGSRFRLAVTSPSRALLVLSQSFERGWRAQVDGRPSPILRTNLAFQGILLESGKHEVDLEYRPRGLREGVGLALAGILATLLVAFRIRASSPAGGDATVSPGR